MNISKITNIQSYKHDGSLHRIWQKTYVLENENNILITGHLKTRVIENDGRMWHTKEPAICYFFNDQWFNVIAMLKKDGLYYYCNLASPYIFDDEGIKYIDYDLDIKVFPNGKYQILDQNEYQYHGVKMNYSEDVKAVINKQLEKLIQKIELKLFPFDSAYVMKYYELLKTYEKKETKK